MVYGANWDLVGDLVSSEHEVDPAASEGGGMAPLTGLVSNASHHQ